MTEPNWVWELDDTPGWGGIVISLRHVDGVPWDEAELPRRWHRCRPQTEAQDMFKLYRRCACGGLQTGHAVHGERSYSSWTDKNKRRKA